MLHSREKSDIDRIKLIFVSFFLFILLFPYSVWGYLCFFPEMFSIMVAYWIASDREKSYGMLSICGMFAVLRYLFGGELSFSILIVVVGFIVSLFSRFFKSDFSSVLKITFLLSLAWSLLNFPFQSALYDSELFVRSSLCGVIKVATTVVLTIAVFPFVKVERKDRFIFWI